MVEIPLTSILEADSSLEKFIPVRMRRAEDPLDPIIEDDDESLVQTTVALACRRYMTGFDGRWPMRGGPQH
jgi:hypothetical protein